MTVEAKGRPAASVKPNAHALFTANWKWPDVDRSSGGRRRFLYVHTPRTVTRRDPFLFEKLREGASGIITWALEMPPDKTRIGHSVEALNELTGGGADCSGLIEWVNKNVRYMPGNEIALMAKKVPLPGSLYEDYLPYVDAHGIEPIPFNQFGDALDDVIRSQGYRDILIKRRAVGRVVQGNDLGHGEPIKKNRITGAMRYLMDTDPWPDFQDDRAEWERGGCKTSGDSDSEDADGDADGDEDLGGISKVNRVNSVDDVDSVDSFDSFDCFDTIDTIDYMDNGHCAEGAGAGGAAGNEGEGDSGGRPSQELVLMEEGRRSSVLTGKLTPQEDTKNHELMEEYPELKEARGRGEEWTLERIVQWAVSNIQVGQGIKGRVSY